MNFVSKKNPHFHWQMLFFFCCFISNSISIAFSADRQAIFKQYEEVTEMAETHHLYQQDNLHIMPKIRRAGEAILKQDFEGAESFLKDIKNQFLILETAKPTSSRRHLKMQWMEMFFGIFQECLILILLALGFAKWPFFHSMLIENRLNIRGKALLTFLFSIFAILFSIYDLSRYGQSAWTSFDIQIPFIIAGGIFGGVGVSLILGAVLALFRYLLEPDMLMFPIIVLGVSGITALFSLRIRSFENLGKVSFMTGLIAGLFHSLMVFIPLIRLMTPGYLVFCVLFIALLEGLGAALFPAVTSAVIRESKRLATEKELLKTRLLFLQAQISPHFLFNALNTVVAILGEENAHRSEQLVMKLSEFFRCTLTRKKEYVTLREEVSYIDAYLEIEKARLGNRLQYVKMIDLPENAWEIKLPILTLQPLVENAVKHGIAKVKGGGKLELKIKLNSANLQIEVHDEGPGINPETLESIRQGKSYSETGTGIGVVNIQQRLKYFFGKTCLLNFESSLGAGTTVSVILPLKSQRSL